MISKRNTRITSNQSVKPRFSASPHKRGKNKEKGGGGGPEHPHAQSIQQAYNTVVLEASELGAAGARSKEDMIKAAAKLASDWTKTNISPDAVRNVVGD